MTRTIWSIGHGTQTHEEFAALLQDDRIRVLVDVRRAPHSRRNPQYNVDHLKRGLHPYGIVYAYLGDELGGRRRVSESSRNVALAGSPMQGYADHQASPQFAKGLAQLEALAQQSSAAFMCAETNYRKCHRRLVGDVLVARGWEVRHIEAHGRWRAHELTPGARIVGEEVVYYPLRLDEVEG